MYTAVCDPRYRRSSDGSFGWCANAHLNSKQNPKQAVPTPSNRGDFSANLNAKYLSRRFMRTEGLDRDYGVEVSGIRDQKRSFEPMMVIPRVNVKFRSSSFPATVSEHVQIS